MINGQSNLFWVNAQMLEMVVCRSSGHLQEVSKLCDSKKKMKESHNLSRSRQVNCESSVAVSPTFLAVVLIGQQTHDVMVVCQLSRVIVGFKDCKQVIFVFWPVLLVKCLSFY